MRYANSILDWFLKLDRVGATGRGLNVYVENDSHNVAGPGSDNGYTSGVKLSYIYSNDEEPEWAKPFVLNSPFLRQQLQNSEANFSFTIGQQIFTPNDTTRSDLIVNDRPYAAWAYIGLSTNFKNEDVANVVELDWGQLAPPPAVRVFKMDLTV